MTGLPGKKSAGPGPSELQCRICGTVEQIRMAWQRCYQCHIRSETRYSKTYPAFCAACCMKLHG